MRRQGSDSIPWAAPASLRRARRRESWYGALLLFVLTFALMAANAFEPLENRLSDVRSRLLDRAPTGQVAIVEIDAKSLAALNKWPWPRHYHAELIKRLGAAHASMIAFDVDFSAKSNDEDDRALAEALKTVEPVILPVFQQRASDAPGESEFIRSRPAATFQSAWTGGVNILPESDGVVRDFPAATMIHGQIQPSMAVLLSDNGTLGDRSFVPDWSIDARRIPRFSFVDVLDGQVPSQSLAGKRVIVGATAIEVGDRYAIPRFGTVPGVVIQALAAESLIQHRTMTRSGPVLTIAGLLLVSLLLLGRFNRFALTFPSAAAGLLALLALVPIAVQSRWPLSLDTAPLIFAAIVAIALRLVVEARHRIRLAAMRDVDTGLPNKRALTAALDEMSIEKPGLTAASIDRFEAIRSALPAEDLAELIASAATLIAGAVEAPVYRIAPDTVAWIPSDGSDPEQDCARVAELFVRPVSNGSSAVDLGWTFGLAEGAAEPQQLTERALAAIVDARKRGRGKSWFQGLAPDALRDLSMMGELRRGMGEGQLYVAYQPKLHLKSGGLEHAEALLRWRHPVEGLVPPDRFVPLAEETGVVCELTRFVLGRALADCRFARQRGSAMCVSVNVSAADIGRPEFAGEVIAMLSSAGVDASALTLEITESAIIRSKDTALRVLGELRDQGVRLSVDDYGTGQSTLSYLKTLPVHELKIDKMFVTQMSTDHSDRIMVRSTIELAHQLGMVVVAEGVEDWETVRLLAELGCDYAQGFAVGKAMAPTDLRSMATAGFKRAA